MGLESASTIAQLNPLWPLGTDPRSQGDDHLRLIKKVMQLDALSKDATDLGTIRGGLAIQNTAPELRFNETDQADPAGRYRFVASSENFYFQRALAANWASTDHIWRYLASGPELTVYPPLAVENAVTAQSYNGILLGRNPAGAASAARISTPTGSQMFLTSGADPALIQFYFRGRDETNHAVMYPTGTTVPSPVTVITREKGDARFAPISSRRYKEGIGVADEGALVAAFDQLAPSRWTWGGELAASDERLGSAGFGFIAEDVDGFLPGAVTRQWVPAGEDEEGNPLPETETRVNGLDALALLAVAVAKIRQLEARVAQLEAMGGFGGRDT